MVREGSIRDSKERGRRKPLAEIKIRVKRSPEEKENSQEEDERELLIALIQNCSHYCFINEWWGWCADWGVVMTGRLADC